MENSIQFDLNSLICDNPDLDLYKQFCGNVFNNVDDYILSKKNSPLLYLTGNISKIIEKINTSFLVIQELSYNYEGCNVIRLGEVPLNYKIGILCKELFDKNNCYFDLI